MAGKRMATSKISKDDPEGMQAPSSEEEEEGHGRGKDTVQAIMAERKYWFPFSSLFSKVLILYLYLIGFLVLPSDMCPVPLEPLPPPM